jgi:hypothetical protein
VEVSSRVAGVQHEALGGLRQLGLDELAAHAHHFGRLVHERAGTPVIIAGGWIPDLQPRFLQHPVGGVQYSLKLFLRQDFKRWPRVVECGDRSQGRT